MALKKLRGHTAQLGLNNVLYDAQLNRECHPRLVGNMCRMGFKVDNDAFILDFTAWLLPILVQNEHSPHYIKALEFIAKFCSYFVSHTKDEQYGERLLTSVVNLVAEVSSLNETTPRHRSCELISLILGNLGDDSIDSDIFEVMTSCMLERIQDKQPSVRCLAVAALQRLQDPQDPDCKVIEAFLYHLQYDPSASVRKAILRNIAISKQTIPVVVKRAMDVQESVRRELFSTITKLKIQRLRIRQRQDVLYAGFNDQSDHVKNYVKNHLVQKWFEDSKEDYITLLEHLDVESLSLEASTTLLESLFKKQPSSELVEMIQSVQKPDKIIDGESLKAELALLWLSVVRYLSDPPDGVVVDPEAVQLILPNLTFYTNYLRQLSTKLLRSDTSTEYMLMRLLDMVDFFCFSDEKGRQELIILCKELLCNVEVESQEFIRLLAKLLFTLIPDTNQRILFINEIISDIKEPLDPEMVLKIGENDGDDLNSSDIREAEPVNESPEVMVKCLQLIVETLKFKDVNVLSPILLDLERLVISPWLCSDSVEVMNLAISALSLLCLLDLDLAKKNFIRLCIWLEEEMLAATCLEAIFDLILNYGLEEFTLGISENTEVRIKRRTLDLLGDASLSSQRIKYLFVRITTQLDSSLPAVRSVTSQGLAKLFLAGRIKSPLIFAKLISLWFCLEGKEAELSQVLGVFFQLFVRKVKEGPGVVLACIVPLVEHVTSAPMDSPEFSVDVYRVAQLPLSLIRHDQTSQPVNGPSYHFELALVIIREIMKTESKSAVSCTLTKLLAHLELLKSDKEYEQELLEYQSELIKRLNRFEDRSLQRIATNFYSKVTKLWGDGDSTSGTRQRRGRKLSNASDDESVDLEGSGKQRGSSLQQNLSKMSIREEVILEEDEEQQQPPDRYPFLLEHRNSSLEATQDKSVASESSFKISRRRVQRKRSSEEMEGSLSGDDSKWTRKQSSSIIEESDLEDEGCDEQTEIPPSSESGSESDLFASPIGGKKKRKT